MKKIILSLFLVSLMLISLVSAVDEITINYQNGQEPTKGVMGFLKDLLQPFSLVSDGYTCSSSANTWKQFIAKSEDVNVGKSCGDNAKVQLYKCNNGGNANGCIGGYTYLGEKERINGGSPTFNLKIGATYEYSCFNCEKESTPSSNYCDSSLWSKASGVSSLCVPKGGEDFKITNIEVKELGSVVSSYLRENTIYQIHVTIKNIGSSGTQFVEVGYYDESGNWLQPFSFLEKEVKNCRVNEGSVQNKKITLSAGESHEFVYEIKTIKVNQDKEIRIGVTAFHRCWTQDVQDNGGDGTTASVYKKITLKNTGLGGTPTPEELCNNAMKDNGETSIDCGGDNCQPCNNGYKCLKDSDCKGTNICLEEDQFCSAKLKPSFEEGSPDVCQDDNVYRTWLNERGQRTLKLVDDCQEKSQGCEEGKCVKKSIHEEEKEINIQEGELNPEEDEETSSDDGNAINIEEDEETSSNNNTTNGGDGSTNDGNGEQKEKSLGDKLISVEEGDYGYYTYSIAGLIIILVIIYFAIPDKKKRGRRKRR